MAVSTPQTSDPAPNPPADRDVSAASSSSTMASPRIEQKHSVAGPGMELKPIGIHNESNTCFLNSTFQALSATAPLTSLLANSPQSPLSIHPQSSLPSASVPPRLVPSLQPDILEPPLYDLLPVTRAFTNSLHRAWRMKEAGGGTYGQGETSSKRSMSLNSLLREIARKYDQYDDYSQQDAHELLRHLLDSMEMEEKDVIKKLQPNLPPLDQHGIYKRRRSKHNTTRSGTTTPGATNHVGTALTQQHLMDLKHISPLPSPLPSPAHTRPPSPGHKDVDPMTSSVPLNLNGRMTGHAFNEEQIFSPSDTPTDVGSEVVRTIPQDERMIPFVDVLFGGSLASVVVCEKCKAVSHTYEGFLDISLSLKGDDPKPRKRDRLRAMARKFRPRKSNSDKTSQSPDIQQSGSFNSVVSESELSETEGPREKDRRKSMDSDDRITIDSNHTNSSAGLGRSASTRAFSGLKAKPSFSFGRKKDKKAASPVIAPSAIMEGEGDHDRTPPTSTPASPSIHSQDLHHRKSHHRTQHGPGPTPAQAAYISRILAPPPGTIDLDDPIAKLRAAQSGQPIDSSGNGNASSEYGLVDALRAFTSVEVLEGENAFACKKCWKIKHGYYAKHEATVKEEDEEQLAAASAEDGFGLPLTSTRGSVSSNVTTSSAGTSPMMISGPQISVMGSPSSEKSNNSSYYDASAVPDGRLGRSHRNTSINSNISKSSIARAPSPLRRHVEADEQQEELSDRLASTNLSSTYGSESALTEDSGVTSNTSVSNDDLAEDDEAQEEEEESDGLSDSETSVDEHNRDKDGHASASNSKSKSKKKSKNTSHVVMGRAFKRYLIAKKPEILVFHFKRFKQTAKSYSFSSFYDLKKIDDFVSFPESLDLAPFLAPNRQDYKLHQTPNGPKAAYMEWANPEQGPDLEPVMYRLYALVVHLGTMIGGHYIAYCLVDPEKMFGGQPSNDANASSANEENKTPTIEPKDQKTDRSNASVRSGQSQRSQQSGLSGMSGIERDPPKEKEKKEDRRVWCFCSE
uniref:USP domain-containing protein n=1 Tax=Kwoniella dejecticola CBS 10117 TaxID=1296121 RepID=A0A1A6A785_9TREE|nr:uncharacterized protein I303_03635 [Kwoniella dejecticola CBS 10117]OBR85920.1 hypothetical protein I303_03635 [Kwoniella dejecticola CBS 10117]